MGAPQSTVKEKGFGYYTDVIDRVDKDTIRSIFSDPEDTPNINMVNDNGDTLLIYAIERRCNSIAEELINLGIDVNIKNSIGWSALFYAVIDDNYSMVNTLLSHGAKPDIKSILEETPLHLAIKRRRLIDIIEMLIEKHDDVDVTDMEGNTPLIWSCMCNDATVSTLLLKKGADPNRRNQYGIYPLVLTPDGQIRTLLLSYGAKL